LNGDGAGGRRQEFVDRFNAAPGFGALLLGPDATGVGLNIVGANHVIHYTRLWNPAKENQATDRVHRIGQTRPVTVYYPIVRGEDRETVEQTLDRLLEEKRALARDVVRPRESLSVEREMLQIFDAPEAA
jgi:SNF2 family DNA or RNA helicase